VSVCVCVCARVRAGTYYGSDRICGTSCCTSGETK